MIFRCSEKSLRKSQDSQLEYVMVWSDEFNYHGEPDTLLWNYDIGDGCPFVCGWGNNELQYYTKDHNNVRVEKGNLIIEAHQEPKSGKEFTSARIISKNKGDWKYGKIEVRAKLPQGIGTWPAIWMLPTENKYGNWPSSGEIDIMEHLGFQPDSIYGTVHTEDFNHLKGTQRGGCVFTPSSESEFHIYTIDWQSDKINWYVDNIKYQSFPNTGGGPSEWPFNQKFHLLMNLAIGGNWGGQKGVAQDIWPQQLLVDYVRIYQKRKE